jgi:hypothetical protein
MRTEAEQIVALLASEETIARDQMRTWMAADDLRTLGAAYALCRTAARRIDPPFSPDEISAMTRRYLLRCIEENPSPSEHVHGGFQAGWELAARMKEWRHREDAAAVLTVTVNALRAFYRRADETTRNRLLCSVLEHAFEDPGLREYFVTWQRSRELRDAYQLALEWGTAHEDD